MELNELAMMAACYLGWFPKAKQIQSAIHAACIHP